MKKRTLSIVFLLFFCLAFKAQTDSVYYGTTSKDTTYKPKKQKNNDWIKRFTYGGNVQAIFGTATYIYLSPTIGYLPFKKLNIGVGIIYTYANINYAGYGRYTQSVYGAHSYARYFVTESFFAQGQFDHLLQPNIYNVNDPKSKVWVDYALVGGGFRQQLGRRASLVTSIMFNLKPNVLSIYPNPIFQVGFVGGF